MTGNIPKIADIKRAVARGFKVDPAVLDQPDGVGARPRDRVRPRQVGMVLALTMTRHSTVRVGMFFGNRDHSTVIHARESARSFLLSEPDTRESTYRAIELLRREGC